MALQIWNPPRNKRSLHPSTERSFWTWQYYYNGNEEKSDACLENSTIQGEAVVFSVNVLNRSLSNTIDTTPNEAWYRKNPDISHFRDFSLRTFGHVPYTKRQKLDKKWSHWTIATAQNKQTVVLVKRKIIEGRDIIFYEDSSYGG